jgi:hypothetical protein
VQKVAEGFALKRFQLGIDRGFVGVHGFRRVSASDVNLIVNEATACDGSATSSRLTWSS